MPRLPLLVLALLALTGCQADRFLRGEEGIMANRTRNLTADPGETITVAEHFRFFDDCEMVVPDVRVTVVPEHGRVETPATERIITAEDDPTGSCVGTSILQRDVIYTADADFPGTDEFIYVRTNRRPDGGLDSFDAQVTVIVRAP